MPIKAISHVGFNCKNLDACIDFYCKILGARVKFYLTYGDMVDDLRRQCAESKKSRTAIYGGASEICR